MSSTDCLRRLAQRDGYLFRQMGQDSLVLKEVDGRDMVTSDDYGREVTAMLPDETLQDFLGAGLVFQDKSNSGNGVIYRLTAEGRRRGRT